MITALQLLKEQIKNSREIFTSTIADVQPDHLHKAPGAKAFPLGATIAHLIFSEDAIIHGMIQGKAPLSATTWKDKTGTTEPMPPMDDNWSEANEQWSKSVKIDLAQFQKYAQAVHEATDAYIETLTDKDLETKIDLGWDKKPLYYLLSEYIAGHTNSLAGEISVLKGLQGLKGYPF